MNIENEKHYIMKSMKNSIMDEVYSLLPKFDLSYEIGSIVRPYTSKERHEIIDGLINGIILSLHELIAESIENEKNNTQYTPISSNDIFDKIRHLSDLTFEKDFKWK